MSVEEVASWVLTSAWCYRQGQHESGGPVLPGERRQDTTAVAVAVARLPRFPPLAVWQGVAEGLVLPDDLRGFVMLADPPYQGTTGYPHGDCPRETVLRLAREWSERGAVVAVCEAEPLPLDGWHHVEVTHGRKGQKRTFSRQQSEWLTLNREPLWRPHRGQVGLFGEAP